MVRTRRLFQFTIGQGMAFVAALAVTFAFLPMPAAFLVACLATTLVALRRNQLSNPAHVETIGCLPCLFSFLGGAILGTMWETTSPGNSGPSVIAGAFGYGLAGSLTAAVFGQLVASMLSERPSHARDSTEARDRELRADIELMETMLVQAGRQKDEEIWMKLAAHKARLEHDLRP